MSGLIDSGLAQLAEGIGRLNEQLEHAHLSVRETLEKYAAELKRAAELEADGAAARKERNEQVEHLNNRIDQILSTCGRIGVDMSRDGYGRNAAADEARAKIRALEADAGNLRGALLDAARSLESLSDYTQWRTHPEDQRASEMRAYAGREARTARGVLTGRGATARSETETAKAVTQSMAERNAELLAERDRLTNALALISGVLYGVPSAETIESIRAAARAALSESPPCPVCRGCGKTLMGGEANYLADGCPCNSARGVNHGLVPREVCTCKECDPAETGASRVRNPELAEAGARSAETAPPTSGAKENACPTPQAGPGAADSSGATGSSATSSRSPGGTTGGISGSGSSEGRFRAFKPVSKEEVERWRVAAEENRLLWVKLAKRLEGSPYEDDINALGTSGVNVPRLLTGIEWLWSCLESA